MLQTKYNKILAFIHLLINAYVDTILLLVLSHFYTNVNLMNKLNFRYDAKAGHSSLWTIWCNIRYFRTTEKW